MTHKTCIASVGDEYVMDQKPWKVTHVGDDLVKLRCISRGYEEEFTYFDFNAAVFEGDIKIPKLARDGVPLPDARLADLPDKLRKRVFKILAYLRQYSVDKYKKSIKGEDTIARVADKLKDESPPDIRTLQRWNEKWIKHEKNWMAFIPKKYFEAYNIRTEPLRDKLLMQVISDLYLVKGSTFSYRAVQEEFDIRLKRPENKLLDQKSVGLNTIGHRLNKVIGRYEVIRQREGEAAAKSYLKSLGVPERATRINQVWEIDETPCDCFVVDDHGEPIGRPILVLVVDVFTDMIVGVCISFRAPSSATIMQALKSAILPKEKLIQGIDDIVGDWPCYGIPESLRTDNINHYWSDALNAAIVELVIEQEHSKVKNPTGKSTVERKFLTLNLTHLNRLPGYVEAISERIKENKLDPQKTAILRLDEFKEHLYKWIVNENNYKKSVRLDDRRPIDVWLENEQFYTPRMDVNIDSLDVVLASGIGARTIQPVKGISHNSATYSNTELQKLRLELINQKKFRKNHQNPSVTFRWYDDDLGYISVLNPITKEYIHVEAVEQCYHGLTLQLYKCANELKKKVKEQDGEHIEVDEAISRTRNALAELSGSKHRIAHQKRMAATQERFDRKKSEAHLVQNGDEYADRINEMATKDYSELENNHVGSSFGDTEHLEG